MHKSGLQSLCILLMFLCMFTGKLNAQDYRKFADIVYTAMPNVDPNLLSLDVYAPDNADNPLPVVIYIHGGGWANGDKARVHNKAEFFTDSAYVFVSINYRLSPDPPDTSDHNRVKYPDHPIDCAKAVRWIYDNIHQYHGDREKMSLIGHSAGAHLVSLLATNEKFLHQEGLELTHIQCVCALDGGAFDIPYRFSQVGDSMRLMYYNAFDADALNWIDASPALNVSTDKVIPPFLLVYQGRARRIELNETFADSLNSHGKMAQLFNAYPYDHDTINKAVGNPEDSIGLSRTVMQFFNTNLKPAPTGPLFELTGVHDKSLGQATAILDADGDGLLDFISASKSRIHLVKNDGNMQFAQFRSETVTGSNGFGMHDFNGDGKMDFMIAQHEDSLNHDDDIRINNGNYTFTSQNLNNESIGAVRNVVIADFDLDGYVDSYHSASAFQNSHHGNQLHPGQPDGTFGPDVIETILQPNIEDFWYDIAHHPVYGDVKWSNIQSKGAFARDLDGDGKPEIIFCAYEDIGYQEDDFAILWIMQEKRGIFILKNNSTPGNFSFADVSKSALGEDAYGTTSDFWNAYSAVPLDYDLDGDFDLFVGAKEIFQSFRQYDTDIVRFYENISTPGNIRFIERTVETNFESFNQLPPEIRSERTFASGIPIDLNNDGWVDLALVNRTSYFKTSWPYVHLFKNNGDKTFSEVPYSEHGLGLISGGRDINYADFDGDGRLDIVLSDGTVGGYYGSDSTQIYKNIAPDNNHWIQLDIRHDGTWAIGSSVKAVIAGTNTIAGYEEVRTDFAYRSKRHPVLHFGLGKTSQIDLEIKTWDQKIFNFYNLTADTLHLIDLSQSTEVREVDEPGRIENFRLYQNFPNPFNPSTTIRFSLPKRMYVTLKVFDVTGREAVTLAEGELSIGEHSVIFDGKGLSAGVYFYRVTVGTSTGSDHFSQTKKLLMIK